jgi:dihydroorotate dehydrogenase
MDIYRSLLRPLLFCTGAETAHRLAIRTAEVASASRWLCTHVERRQTLESSRLAIEIKGLRFRSPLGLAAGFDKSARAVRFLAALGFGHVEVGSISAEPSAGNLRPRLFRIPKDRGIVVNYGLPNDGATRVAERLKGLRACAPLGINIVSTNRGPSSATVPDEAVIGDYLRSVRRLQSAADYLCLNLSCPNTREGRDFFHEPSRLRQLLDGLNSVRPSKPLFLKVAPFATMADLETFLFTVEPSPWVAGFSVNLPPGKPDGLVTAAARLARMPGAVSGPAAARAADRTILELYRRMDRSRYRIIGSGGVFTAQDAYRKIRLGASLVQMMTALIYEGPQVVRAITHGLDRLLEADGIARVEDAVGLDSWRRDMSENG